MASAPRVFTKLLKPVYSALRSAGHLSSGYIDDSYLQGDTFEECRVNMIDTTTMFMQLGFFVHPDKSVFVPTQRLTFLDFVLDSVHMTVTPIEDKVRKILSNCNLLLQNDNPTIRHVAEVIGILVSNFPGAQYGPLHYRHLERGKYSTLVANKGDYSSAMHLSQPALTEIQWLNIALKAQYLSHSPMPQSWDGELCMAKESQGGGGHRPRPNPTSIYLSYMRLSLL